MSRYKYLEEKAKSKGKLLLIENVALDINLKNLEVFDKPRIIESVDKTEYSARAIVRGVPTSKFTENLNGRIYTRELDERLIREGSAEGNLSLADHPEDDGSVKNICGVWHNPTMDENFSYGDWYLVGEYGQLIAETLQAGGKVGTSRVGLGDFLSDGKTVNPETYELERYSDAVITPSQEVYATFEHITESNYSKPEVVVKKNNINTNISESITNNKVVNNDEILLKEEKIEVENMSDKIQEVAFKNQINRAIKEAKKSEDIMSGIEDLTSYQIPEHMVEEQKAVRDAIVSLQEKLEASNLVLADKVVKTQESFEEVKNKYDVQSKMLESMKDKFQKINSIIKEHGLESIKDIETMKESITDAVHDIKILKEEKTNMLSDLKVLMTERVDMLKDIKVFIKKQKIAESERSDMLADLAVYEEKTSFSEKYIEELEKLLKKEGYKIVEDEDAEDTENEDGEDVVKEENVKSTKGNFSHLNEEDDEEEKEDEEIKESEEDDDEDEEIKESADEDEDEEMKESEEDEEEEDEEKKKESFQKKMIKKELAVYFQEQVKSFPGLKDFKSEIIRSKSFIEASKKIEKIKEKKQEQIKFSEVKLESSWIPKGRK